jgi:hypothetical protein
MEQNETMNLSASTTQYNRIILGIALIGSICFGFWQKDVLAGAAYFCAVFSLM